MEAKVELKAETLTSSASAESGGKKKKLPAHLAALQKKQEELRKQEEEKARFEAEEKARIEELERIEAEQIRKAEEIKAERKRRERERIEQQKREGTYMTKAQKEAKLKAERRNQQLLQSGANVKVAGLEGETEKKKPIYDRKKKGKKEVTEVKERDLTIPEAELEKHSEPTELDKRDLKARLVSEATKEEDEDEDWEAAADKDEDDIKDSWDAPSDDEERPLAKPNGKSLNNQTLRVQPSSKDVSSSNEIKLNKSGLQRESRKEEQSDSDSYSEEEDEKNLSSAARKAAAQKKAEAAERRQKQHEEALAARSKDNLRSPICCILGHVDTGKTKLLDKIRQTNVQEGEAGGITQQIGATYFPVDAIREKTAVVNKDGSFEFKVPGLLVIDTPGHESFSNLRSRGSSLCNIAILVVDIMHGLEPQTLESMKLLRDRQTPFIVALNKIDRLYGWKTTPNNGFQDSLSRQNKSVQSEFKTRLEQTKVAFAEQRFNAELFYENKNMRKYVSLVPTSAHTGEGIPDMLKLLISLTQERMTDKLMYLSEVECTVLEVKIIEGLGTTIDVILSNGVLKEGDRIVVCGLDGAIVTNIRALLTPAPLKELRLKSQYVHNKEAKASLGIKIAANELDNAIAGSRLLVVGPDDDEEALKTEVMADLRQLASKTTAMRGVSVQASTLGSLEALLEFLRTQKPPIPVATISIGPVSKRDVIQAGAMLEKAPEFAIMLCFDVKVDKEIQQFADEQGIKIFTANIIYHLFDDFTKHMEGIAAKRKEESKLNAVFPCVLTPIQVFMKKDPIVIGVDVTDGNLRLLTPIAAIKTNPVTGVKDVVQLGRVCVFPTLLFAQLPLLTHDSTSIQRDHKALDSCKKGAPSIAIKIEGPNQPLYGRQLEEKDILYSLISRNSIDTLKEFYRDEVSKPDWALIKKLKPLFNIP